jgi:hypothetical protein
MFYGNNPFQRPMFGGQYGALSPFGKDIMDQIGRKEEGNIGGFLGEVRDMAEDRFEIDFDGNRYGISPPRLIAFGNKATQADVFDSPDKATEEQPPVLMENGGEPETEKNALAKKIGNAFLNLVERPTKNPVGSIGVGSGIAGLLLEMIGDSYSDGRRPIITNPAGEEASRRFEAKYGKGKSSLSRMRSRNNQSFLPKALKTFGRSLKGLSPVGAFYEAMGIRPAYAEGGEVMPMQEGGAPMYADQGSQFMPAAGRPPVPASVQMANELDQIDRMKKQRESTIVQKIAEQRGVPVQEVLRLLALANAAGATQNNPRMSQAEMERMEGLMPSVNNLDSPETLMMRARGLQALKENRRMPQAEMERMEEFMPQEMGQTNIPYPDAPSATVMQQGGPNPSEWNMLTEGEKMRILNNLEMGNVTRPEVAVPMQEGGNVGIAALPQMGAGQPSPPMPAAPMAGIDPAMVEQALSQMEGQVPQIDDAEDYEQMMNTIRGDEQPMEARYDELAGVVGEEDAAQTPESVLALVQPVMVMASVDQGIGGLAQEEMTQPIEGEMAGGIMSMAGQPQGV